MTSIKVVVYMGVMNVPHNQNLHSQTFNSQFVEFVWQFPETKNQVVYKVYKDNTTLIQEGTVNEAGDYTYEDGYTTSGIISTKNIAAWELAKLKDEVVEYLKS